MCLLGTEVERNVLGNLEVDPVLHGSCHSAPGGVLTPMGGEVLVGSEETLELSLVVVVVERHACKLGIRRDVDEAVGAALTGNVGLEGIGVPCVGIVADVHVVEALVEETEGSVGLRGVAHVGNDPVGGDECGVSELGLHCTVHAIVSTAVVQGGHLVTEAFLDTHGVAPGVSCHEGETEAEVLLELCGHGVVVTVYGGVVQIVRGNRTVLAILHVSGLIGGTGLGLTGKLYTARDLFVTETAGCDSGEVLVEDSLDGSLDVTGQTEINCERGLPAGGHLEVLVDDGSPCRSCEILGLERTAVDFLEDVSNICVEMRGHGVGTIGVDVLGLEAVAVAGHGYDPHERNPTGVDTGTAPDDEGTILECIPVETYPRGEVQASLGHVTGGSALEGGVGLCKSLILLVDIAFDRRIERHLETETCGELEVVAQVHLILHIQGSLHVIEGGEHLCEVIAVGVGDSESNGLLVILEGLPGVEHVVSETALHEAVLGIVVLELHSADDVVPAEAVGELVGEDHGVDVTKVAVGEGVGTEGGDDSPVSVHILYLAVIVEVHVLEDIDRREVSAHEGTGLILVGPGDTEHVHSPAVEHGSIQLSCQGGEVLLLEVTVTLERHGVIGSTTEVVPVVGVRVDGVDGVGRVVGIVVMSVAEPDIELLGIINDPVEPCHYLPVGSAQGEALVPSGIIVIGLGQVVLYFIHEALGRTGCGATGLERGIHPAGCGAHGLAGTGNRIEGVLPVDEEEELILDDGTAHCETGRVVQGLAEGELGITYVVATELVVCEIIVHGSVELVGTALGDGVDGTTGEAALADIERSDADAHLLEGIQGNGATACREVAADTEGIVESCTVDGHIGGTVVSAAHRETVGGSRCLGSEFHHIVHAAAYRRKIAHGLLAYGSTCAGTVDVH